MQNTGLLLEITKYGKATYGYEFFEEFQKQVSLSQTFSDPFARQYIARFGIVAGFELVEQNESVLEKIVEGIKVIQS